jgi:hypothetical protein
MPFQHSQNPTEATAAKGSTPMRAYGPIEAAYSAASQLSSHFGNKAIVELDGPQVRITSPLGIKEADWFGAGLTLRTTTTVPQITRMGISFKNTDGDWDVLQDSATAATSVLNKELRETGKKAQTEAVATGATAYSFQLPKLAGIDTVTSVFDEDTTSREKKVNAATMDFTWGTYSDSGVVYRPYVPEPSIGGP